MAFQKCNQFTYKIFFLLETEQEESVIENLNGEDLQEKAREVMKLEFMSSEESDLSEDEEGNMTIKGYLTKSLPWERSALKAT